jgi:hypothetical protein
MREISCLTVFKRNCQANLRGNAPRRAVDR